MRRCMVMAVLAALAACGGDSTGPELTSREQCARLIDAAVTAHGTPYSQDTTYHTYGTSDTTVTLVWSSHPPMRQAWTWYGTSDGCFEGLYQPVD